MARDETLWPRSARLVSLAEGLSMMPLSDELLSELSAAGGHGSDSRFEFLTPAVASLAARVSRQGPVAYVETEYVGGEGFERAIVWRGEAVAAGPLDGPGAINQALRLLGVMPPEGREPFDLVGLGRCRSPGEWLLNT